ncbi:MAG: hypothetical protein L0210_02755 [Rhodospirillales bacterium]|nr:hypothetical protein [Rhodospirillales bacterium]
MASPKEIQAALIGYPHQLRWDEFKKVDELPDGVQPEHDAGVAMDFKVTHYGVLWAGGKALHKPQVTVVLDSSNTWATDRARTDKKLLAHEQGHFDITGLIARDLAATLLDLQLDPKKLEAEMTAPAANPAEHEAKVQRVNRMWKVAMNKAVDRAQALARKLNNTYSTEGLYDLDTSHGTDRDSQTEWDRMLQHVKLTYANFEETLRKFGWLYDPRPFP